MNISMHMRHVKMEIQLQAQPEFKGNSFTTTLTRHIHMEMALFAKTQPYSSCCHLTQRTQNQECGTGTEKEISVCWLINFADMI